MIGIFQFYIFYISLVQCHFSQFIRAIVPSAFCDRTVWGSENYQCCSNDIATAMMSGHDA